MTVRRTPTQGDLLQAIELLSLPVNTNGAATDLTADRIAEIGQWSRLDGRVAQVMVRWLSENFYHVHPLQLRLSNRAKPTPQVIGVLLDFALIRLQRLHRAEGKSLPRNSQVSEFKQWAELTIGKIDPAPFQTFFVGLSIRAHQQAQRNFENGLLTYQRWGFWGQDDLAQIKVGLEASCTLLTKNSRQYVLENLIATKAEITVQDYLIACGHQVHPRTAERDLLQHPHLRAIGFTRSRRYLKRPG